MGIITLRYKSAIVMKVLHSILLGVLVLTYAIPWVRVGEEQFSPGQLTIPYSKFLMTRIGMIKLKEDSPHELGDVLVYDKSLRYLSIPHNEGGPRNQITFEIVAFSMAAIVLLLLIPLKLTRIIGYSLGLATSAAFFLAMLTFEGKAVPDIGVGLYSNMVVSAISLIITSLLK